MSERQIRYQRADGESWCCRMMGQCQAAVAEAVYAYGRIDILFCCTSQAIIGTVEEMGASNRTQALVRDQFETTFFGPMNIIKATLPHMREQKIGHMVVLGGITGHLGTPGLGMYCAATWALEGFCDSIAYEIAPFNIKMTIVQASIEIGILLNRITSVPPLPAYSPDVNSAPLFRGILDGLLNRLPGIRAQYVTPSQAASSSPCEMEGQCEASLLSRDEVVSLYPPLSQAHTEKLLAETIHALTAIGGHENPPARHIVGVEGVASVKEKLKTVSEELEDFIEASHAVDVQSTGSHGNAQAEAADGEDDGPVDFGSHDPEDRQGHS
jgi:short chain dehydrogenase